MQWLKGLWNRIVSSNDEPYLQKIKELEEELKDANEEIVRIDSVIDGWIANYEEMKRQYESMQNTKNELLEELEGYKKVEVPYTIPTDIIDTSKFPYLPAYKSLSLNYITKKIEQSSHEMTPSKFYRNWTDEMFQFVKLNIKGMTNEDEIIVKLRNLAYDRVKYKTDILAKKDGTLVPGENWKPAEVTWRDEEGDCEDSTILWVCFCAIAGIPADRIFNATGFYKQFNDEIGHSWGLAKFNNGHWYVIETTAKKKPVKFLGSDYRIPLDKSINGLTNWALAGKAKKEQF